MELPNEIVLRPRFRFMVNHNNESLLSLFEVMSNKQSDYILTRVDDHVYIKIPVKKQHFWSPQLHLEISEDFEDKDKSIIHGLFGPSPTVWTMFMFFHFVVATLFIGFVIWAYVNWTLDKDYIVQLFLTLFMIFTWVTLYVAGRLGKKTGLPQMHELHHFMRDTLRSKDIHAIS